MNEPTQEDVEAAQRGLRMVAMSIAELKELATLHTKLQPNFADRVIVIGANLMIAAKRRMGAKE